LPTDREEGEILQRVRGLVTATIVGVPLAMFLFFWLHATREFAVLAGFGIGLAIFAVVATGNGAQDAASDAAWRAAAPDLPPVSDRVIMERNQASMPGLEKQRRPGVRSHGSRDRAPSAAASQEAESR
jgi:hypothetical protein